MTPVVVFPLPALRELLSTLKKGVVGPLKPLATPAGKRGRPEDYREAFAVVKVMKPKTTWADLYTLCKEHGISVPDDFETFKRTMQQKLAKARKGEKNPR